MQYNPSRRRMQWAIALWATALVGGAASGAWADEQKISVTSVETIVQQSPLQPGGPTAKVSGSSRAGHSELQVIELSKIKLHHHDQEDHVVYIARGRGILRMGEKGTETRQVKPGDIITLPRGVPHGFEKQGEEHLVLLVVATAG